MKRHLRAALPALFALALIAAPFAAQAQIKLLPPCTASGNCGISDILAVFVNVAEYLLGISGAVALGFFVYGGFVFVLSRGKPDEVKKAFTILRNAVIGIAIIFTSGILVRFTTQALTGGSSNIPTIGETCKYDESKPGQGVSAKTGDGLWLSIPAGVTNDGKVIPEGLVCVRQERAATKAGAPCANLNGVLEARQRSERYTCQDVEKATSCVRGLCVNLSASYACCISQTAPKK